MGGEAGVRELQGEILKLVQGGPCVASLGDDTGCRKEKIRGTDADFFLLNIGTNVVLAVELR